METIHEMFHSYLAELFPDAAEFEDDGRQSLRIVYPMEQTVAGRRYSRPVVLHFDEEVIAEFRAAIGANDVARQERIGDLLEEMVRTCLGDYDDDYGESGPRDTAFQIDVDSRVLDM